MKKVREEIISSQFKQNSLECFFVSVIAVPNLKYNNESDL